MDNLSVNELDFDAVKAELITFMNSQTEFQDYDFTGSALNTLIDVCAYLIHYVGVQANFALRESFLESAQLRKNVSAIAKELGYFPSQKKAGRGSFTISLDIASELQPSSITIPKGTTFVSTLQDGSTISFVTFDDNPLFDTGLTAGQPATGIWEGVVFVAQGTFANQYWTNVSSDQRYLIEQEGIDNDFLTVIVKPTEGSTEQSVWTYGKNITEVGPTTEAYFLSESNDGIEVYFGNDVIGKSIQLNNYIEAEYLVTEGALANGIKTFALTSDIAGYARQKYTIDPALVDQVADAADRETMDSIRFLAPLSYQRQNRIVTIEDYKVAVLENYSNVKAINAWGGEDAEPPEYGKVFVSVAPVVGDAVSPTTKKSIEEDILSKFSVVGIQPEIIDPEYLIVNLLTSVTYNKDKTTLKASQIASLAESAIADHFDTSVFDYNQSFKYSKMLAEVDAIHLSVTHSLADVTITKNFTPVSNVTGTYTVKFYNAVVPGTLVSSSWIDTAGDLLSMRDNSNGTIDLYVDGVLVRSNIGTIDYTTGDINLPGFNAKQALIAKIGMTAQPSKFDVDVRFNNLAQLGVNTATAVEETR